MYSKSLACRENIIEIKGLKIYYIEINESNSDIIFFIHGNSCSHRTWDLQVNEKEFKKYRLIIFDLPGHGNSSASNNAINDYSVVGTGVILAEAVKQIALQNRYFLIGLCSGSNIIAEMLSDNEIKPATVIFISANVVGADIPLQNVFKQNKKLSVMFNDECDEDEIIDLWEGEGIRDRSCIEILINDHLRVANNFRSTLAETVVKQIYSDEIGIIQQREVPVLVIFGEHDSLINIDYLDSQTQYGWKIVKLNNSGHLVHITSPKEVNTLISNFCESNYK
jgi:pimeloyl-ACP methyl ester carboxylesterase